MIFLSEKSKKLQKMQYFFSLAPKYEKTKNYWLPWTRYMFLVFRTLKDSPLDENISLDWQTRLFSWKYSLFFQRNLNFSHFKKLKFHYFFMEMVQEFQEYVSKTSETHNFLRKKILNLISTHNLSCKACMVFLYELGLQLGK